ncbi:ThiS family protein [Desulfotomaculum arcticum]|uniref:ThiS family protein n=1 Tax=Desulfotruncus arcticus DSM 17038 TaxID=1121424 RepID=A0A1I2WMY2_9FIRM|nr:MoaD/ThiS family protein [Desulfotruncus arcticus]SFH02760.1 ThiS family protein [Desulfotomaculum arcticum] [Desulfotruncus arcticus DSM 17038]
MQITLRATGIIREKFPNKQEKIVVMLDEPLSVQQILTDQLGIDVAGLAAIIVNGQCRRRDYLPVDGDVVTLVPPLGGG